jgi:hypothetical protein
MDKQQAIIVIGAAAVLWTLWFVSRMQSLRSKSGSGQADATITWLGSYSVAFQRALDICELLELEVVDADPNHGAITAKAPLMPTIRIKLCTQEGITTLILHASSGMMDIGQSQRIMRRFVEIWDRMPEPVK